MQCPKNKTFLYNVCHWLGFIETSTTLLNLLCPPTMLSIVFIVQSIECAERLKPRYYGRLSANVRSAHIRGYLIDRIWMYQMATTLVEMDLKARGVANADRISNKAVVDLMLSRDDPSGLEITRIEARRIALRTLEKKSPADAGQSVRGGSISVAVPISKPRKNGKLSSQVSATDDHR